MKELPETITFEEVLLLRLAFEMTDAMKHTRSSEYTNFLTSIVPEFEEYRLILNAIMNLPEENLPRSAAITESKIKPYPVG